MTQAIVEPAEVFGEIRELLSRQADPEQVFQAVVNATVRLVPRCDRAALALVDRNGRARPAAASDPVAARVGELELQVGEGPCQDVIADEAYQFDPDIREGTAWPRLVERVLAETPVRGMVAYRLVMDGATVGALMLLSDQPDALDQASADHGAVLASFAAVAVMTSRAQTTNAHLERALESSREIGKAVGLLMAAHRITDDQAFEILRKTSQDLNVRLATLAREVVEGQRKQLGRAQDVDTLVGKS